MAKSIYIDAEFPISIAQLITLLPGETGSMFVGNPISEEKLYPIIGNASTTTAINQKLEQLREKITELEDYMPVDGEGKTQFEAFKVYPVRLVLYVLAFTNLEAIKETGHSGTALAQERTQLRFISEVLTRLRDVIYNVDNNLTELASYQQDNNNYQRAINDLRAILCLPAALLSIDKRQTEVITEHNKTTGTVGFLGLKLPGMGTTLTLPPSTQATLNSFIFRSLSTIAALSDENTDTIYAWIRDKMLESYENDFNLCAKLHFPLLAYMSQEKAYHRINGQDTSIDRAITNFTELLSRQKKPLDLGVSAIKDGANYFKINPSAEQVNRYLLSLLLMAKNFAYIASSNYIAATHKGTDGKSDKTNFHGVCDRVRFNGVNAADMALKLLIQIQLVMLYASNNEFTLDLKLTDDIEALKTSFLNHAFLHRIESRTPLDTICNRHLLSLFLILNQNDTSEFQVLTPSNAAGTLPLYKTQENTITQDGRVKTISTKVKTSETVNFALPRFNRSVIALLQHVNLWVKNAEYQALNQTVSSLFHKLAIDTAFRDMVATLWGASPLLLVLEGHLSTYKSALYATFMVTEQGQVRIVAIPETGVVKTITTKDLQNLIGVRSAMAFEQVRQDYEQTLDSYHRSKWALRSKPVDAPSSSTMSPSTLGGMVQHLDLESLGANLRKTNTSNDLQAEQASTDMLAQSVESGLSQVDTSSSSSAATPVIASTTSSSLVFTDKLKPFNKQLEAFVKVQLEQDQLVQKAERTASPEIQNEAKTQRDIAIDAQMALLVTAAAAFTSEEKEQILKSFSEELKREKQKQDALVDNLMNNKNNEDLLTARINREAQINLKTLRLSTASKAFLPSLLAELPSTTLFTKERLAMSLPEITAAINIAKKNIHDIEDTLKSQYDNRDTLISEEIALSKTVKELEKNKQNTVAAETARLNSLTTEAANAVNLAYDEAIKHHEAEIQESQRLLAEKKLKVAANQHHLDIQLDEQKTSYIQLNLLNLLALVHYRKAFLDLLHQDKLALSQLSKEQGHRGYIDVKAMDAETLLKVTQLAFQKAYHELSTFTADVSEQAGRRGESRETALMICDGAARAYDQALLAFGRAQLGDELASRINPPRALLIYLALDAVKQSGIAFDVETYKVAEAIIKNPLVENVDAVKAVRQKAADAQGQARAAVEEKATKTKHQDLQKRRAAFLTKASASAPSIVRQLQSPTQSSATQPISADSPPEQIFTAYITVLAAMAHDLTPALEPFDISVLRALDYCIFRMRIKNPTEAINLIKTPFSSASSSSSDYREKDHDKLIEDLTAPALESRARELLDVFLDAYTIVEAANARPVLQDPFDLASLPSSSHSSPNVSSSSTTATGDLFSLDDAVTSSSMHYSSSSSSMPNLSHPSSLDVFPQSSAQSNRHSSDLDGLSFNNPGSYDGAGYGQGQQPSSSSSYTTSSYADPVYSSTMSYPTPPEFDFPVSSSTPSPSFFEAPSTSSNQLIPPAPPLPVARNNPPPTVPRDAPPPPEVLVSIPVPGLLIPQPGVVNPTLTAEQLELAEVFVSSSSSSPSSSTGAASNDIPAPPGPPGPPPPPPPPPPPAVVPNATPARGALLKSLSFADDSGARPKLMSKEDRDRLRAEKAAASTENGSEQPQSTSTPPATEVDLARTLARAIGERRTDMEGSSDDENGAGDPWDSDDAEQFFIDGTPTSLPLNTSTQPSAAPAAQLLSQNIAGLHQPAKSNISTGDALNLLDFSQ